MAAEITYRFQYIKGEQDITADPFAEQDADRVRLWSGAHGDVLLVEVYRDDHGNGWYEPEAWGITGTDLTWPDVPDWKKFATPVDALAAVIGKSPAREAVCRCGEPGGQCD